MLFNIFKKKKELSLQDRKDELALKDEEESYKLKQEAREARYEITKLEQQLEKKDLEDQQRVIEKSEERIKERQGKQQTNSSIITNAIEDIDDDMGLKWYEKLIFKGLTTKYLPMLLDDSGGSPVKVKTPSPTTNPPTPGNSVLEPSEVIKKKLTPEEMLLVFEKKCITKGLKQQLYDQVITSDVELIIGQAKQFLKQDIDKSFVADLKNIVTERLKNL